MHSTVRESGCPVEVDQYVHVSDWARVKFCVRMQIKAPRQAIRLLLSKKLHLVAIYHTRLSIGLHFLFDLFPPLSFPIYYILFRH